MPNDQAVNISVPPLYATGTWWFVFYQKINPMFRCNGDWCMDYFGRVDWMNEFARKKLSRGYRVECHHFTCGLMED